MRTAPAALFLILFCVCQNAFPQEETQYKKFKFERSACDVGVLYKVKPDGMLVGVSALATGKGAEFRHWEITDIRLYLENDIIKPDKTNKFYVTKESYFRVPAAILFFILGTQVDVGGTGLEQGIGKAGIAIGLGLLALQAKGDITGSDCIFHLDKNTVDNIDESRDTIRITIENQRLHEQETIRIGLARSLAKRAEEIDYSKMSQNDLVQMVDSLEIRVKDLEIKQENYKYGVDAEYDSIQKEI